jgi:TonB family protein
MARSGFSFSGVVHGGILVWLIAGAPQAAEDRAKSLYDLQIRSHEKEIVWYRPNDRLPDVSPAPARPNSAPPRAQVLHRQTLVAGTRDDAHPAPKIWMPDKIELPKQKLPPLPNALAVAATPPPRALKPFAAQSLERKKSLDMPSLPEALQTSLAAPASDTAAISSAKAPPRRFTLPPDRKPAPVALSLPDALQAKGLAAAVSSDLTIPAAKAPPRRFTPPAAQSAHGNLPVLEATFSEPPAIPTPGAEAALAIASLTPAAAREIPKPVAPHDANFSAGPTLRSEGGASGGSVLQVPGLLARGGDALPASMVGPNGSIAREANLLAGVRPTPGGRPPVPPAAPATRVSEAPDARLEGRAVYTLAIQMPNVTSYMSSWIVWFAERLPAGDPSSLRPPSALRKVDPRYTPSAMSERVEGTIRLFAVIRKDGTVDEVSLVRRLDARLDQSASEALAKWRFEPATRAGVPVEVDAIFEIPFRLAPRATR